MRVLDYFSDIYDHRFGNRLFSKVMIRQIHQELDKCAGAVGDLSIKPCAIEFDMIYPNDGWHVSVAPGYKNGGIFWNTTMTRLIAAPAQLLPKDDMIHVLHMVRMLQHRDERLYSNRKVNKYESAYRQRGVHDPRWEARSEARYDLANRPTPEQIQKLKDEQAERKAKYEFPSTRNI